MDGAIQLELVRIADRLATEAVGPNPELYIRRFRTYYSGLIQAVAPEETASTPEEPAAQERPVAAVPPAPPRPLVAVGPGRGSPETGPYDVRRVAPTIPLSATRPG